MKSRRRHPCAIKMFFETSLYFVVAGCCLFPFSVKCNAVEWRLACNIISPLMSLYIPKCIAIRWHYVWFLSSIVNCCLVYLCRFFFCSSIKKKQARKKNKKKPGDAECCARMIYPHVFNLMHVDNANANERPSVIVVQPRKPLLEASQFTQYGSFGVFCFSLTSLNEQQISFHHII